MKINYLISLIFVLSISIFSQSKYQYKLDSLQNKLSLLQKNEQEKQQLYKSLNQLRLESQKKNIQKENYEMIPLPPSDSSNSKFEILPNSKREDFKTELLNKKKKSK
ncbi:MAG: hypothetical protein IPH62_00955 [Ignavibacteriae bacterium]|nr:hypothetical protein [Ignavibacteriota bacterium]